MGKELFELARWVHLLTSIPLLALSTTMLVIAAIAWRKAARGKLPAKPERWPSISVFVPAYNEAAHIEACLQSILAADYPSELLEVFVVDDGSEDDTPLIAERLQQTHANGQLLRLRNTAHQGKARALNEVLPEITGELLTIVDADTRITAGCFKAFARQFTDPAVLGCSSMVHIERPRNLLEGFQLLEYCSAFFIQLIFHHAFRSSILLSGQTMCLRSEYLRSLGGFPLDILTEDYEIYLRGLVRGGKMVVASDAIVHTEPCKTLSAFIRQRARWMYGFLQVQWRCRKEAAAHIISGGRNRLPLLLIYFDRWFFAGYSLLAVPALLILMLYLMPQQLNPIVLGPYFFFWLGLAGAFRYMGMVATGEWPISWFFFFGALAACNYFFLYLASLYTLRRPKRFMGYTLFILPYVCLMAVSFQSSLVRFANPAKRRFID